MAVVEQIPLIATRPKHDMSQQLDRVSLRGVIIVFCAALAVFCAASYSARCFPQGLTGRNGATSLEALSPSAVALLEYKEVSTTLAPVHVTTAECTGDHSKPVVRGVDLVAYFSLAPGRPAILGSEDYAVIYHQYIFYFSSLENMLMFEADPVRYLPAWGGFCSYGVAREVVWTAENLGPASNPDYWLIYNGVLYLFRSEVPLEKFIETTEQNIGHGKQMWNMWFADSVLRGSEDTPFNTACFCTVDTCTDA